MIASLLRKTVSYFGRLRRDEKGAAMVEYAILVAGIALVSITAVSLLGSKVNDMYIGVATIIPGAHAGDNGPMVNGGLIETTTDAKGRVIIDVPTIVANSGTPRLGNNLGIDLTTLVQDPQ